MTSDPADTIIVYSPAKLTYRFVGTDHPLAADAFTAVPRKAFAVIESQLGGWGVVEIPKGASLQLLGELVGKAKAKYMATRRTQAEKTLLDWRVNTKAREEAGLLPIDTPEVVEAKNFLAANGFLKE